MTRSCVHCDSGHALTAAYLVQSLGPDPLGTVESRSIQDVLALSISPFERYLPPFSPLTVMISLLTFVLRVFYILVFIRAATSQITSPTADTTWQVGSEVTVTWCVLLFLPSSTPCSWLIGSMLDIQGRLGHPATRGLARRALTRFHHGR